MGQTVKARAASDPRIRYRKLDKNDGIAGNTNQGFAMVKGDYVALLDHDDILHPCALWYVAQAIAEPTSCIRTRSPLRATSTT